MVDRTTLFALGALAGFGIARTLRSRARHRVRGKVVLLTGGSRGLGLALARELGRRGARLAILARGPEGLRHAADDLGRRGIEVLAIPCDVTRPEEVGRALARIRERLGPIDVLVNNAGRIEVGPVEHMTIEDYRASMELHFWAPLGLTEAVLPEMRARGRGHVVNVASMGGVVAVPHLVPYTASKHALVGLSRGLAAELPREGITVTTVLPSRIRTGSAQDARFKGHARREYAWFAASGVAPGFSIAVVDAARRIADAIEDGRRELVLGGPIGLLVLAEWVAPGLFGGLGRLLPGPGGVEERARTGRELGFTPSGPGRP